MLLAPQTLFFRVHTRVFLTLLVALSIALLSLSGSVQAPTPSIAQAVVQPAPCPALPLESARTDLPRTVIRLFVLLPRLVPHER